jgi:hypothetical protein
MENLHDGAPDAPSFQMPQELWERRRRFPGAHEKGGVRCAPFTCGLAPMHGQRVICLLVHFFCHNVVLDSDMLLAMFLYVLMQARHQAISLNHLKKPAAALDSGPFGGSACSHTRCIRVDMENWGAH